MAAQGITVIPLSDESGDESSAPADHKKVAYSEAPGDTQSRSVHTYAHTAATHEAAGTEAERGADGDASAAPPREDASASGGAGGRDAAGALARVSTDEELITITEAGTGKEYKVQKVRAGTALPLVCCQGTVCVEPADGHKLRVVATRALCTRCAPCAHRSNAAAGAHLCWAANAVVIECICRLVCAADQTCA